MDYIYTYACAYLHLHYCTPIPIPGVLSLRLFSLVMLNVDWTRVTEVCSLEVLRAGGKKEHLLIRLLPYTIILVALNF